MVIVRVISLFLGKNQAKQSLLELVSANSDNQVLTVLRSGKKTSVVWTYGKKAVDGTVKSTEAFRSNQASDCLYASNLFRQTFTQRVCPSRGLLRT